jgi:hypothetical protein
MLSSEKAFNGIELDYKEEIGSIFQPSFGVYRKVIPSQQKTEVAQPESAF